MEQALLHKTIQDFIDDNLNIDINTLLLKGKTIHEVPTRLIVEQIEAKRKSRLKLPTWFNASNIYYPKKLNIEQTSSELTAAYKAELVSGKSLIDITGGFGVDCHAFSKVVSEVTHVEQDEQLSDIAKHNFEALEATNINCVHDDGISYLKNTEKTFDWIYIDPLRRHDVKGRVFFLEDSLPHVPRNLELLHSKADYILIKTSPLLDISNGIKSLRHVKAIHVVSVKNEVKELLWILDKEYSGAIEITAIDLAKPDETRFNFTLEEEQSAIVSYKGPQNYVYEPNAALLKAGAFKTLAKALDVHKLHVNSHLYTSETLVEFPGRCFKLEAMYPFQKKQLKRVLPKKANVSIRNFPESVSRLRQLFGIKDGGNDYLFFTTDKDNNKIVLLCSKAV